MVDLNQLNPAPRSDSGNPSSTTHELIVATPPITTQVAALPPVSNNQVSYS